MKKALLLILIFFTALCQSLWATHNRAGEITYKVVPGTGGKSYDVTVTTYTKFEVNNPGSPSNQADRSTIVISWGDGQIDTIPRTGEDQITDVIKKNVYTSRHAYSGPSGPTGYRVSVEDPNRNANIINLGPNNSDQIPFYIETYLIVSPFLGSNTSPTLLNPPIDDACTFKKFIHNPGAYDPDGDSLSYELVKVKGGGGADIVAYFIPPNVTLSQNGDLVWDVPTQQGIFNFAILITEWRRGSSGNFSKIGSVLRDMQVFVEGNCFNNPPVIDPLTDTCVLAGTLLTLPIRATDIDNHDVKLTATGEPFLIANPASFIANTFKPVPVTDTLIWQTACENVRTYPFKILFKAEDLHVSNPLVDYKTLNITVVGPEPGNPQATPQGNNILVTWNASTCPQVTKYFIYRRNGKYNFVPDNCELGVPAYTGYSFIATVNGLNNTSYIDNNGGSGLTHGNEYCYMIVAVYPDGAQSYASDEVCAQLKKDVPIITNVSVNATGNPGENYIAWSKPTELDTITQNPGPFKYLIYRSSDINGGALTLIDSTSSLSDTTYVDKSANTADNANSYRIDLYNNSPGNRYLIGNTHIASSVFLTIASSDNTLMLSWSFNVPWSNSQYIVYKKNDVTGLFDSLSTVTGTSYTDTGLINSAVYCYYVKSLGSYSTPGIINPIINLSQQECATPIDITPPCSPVLAITPDCNIPQNTLIWNNPNNICADDVVQYNIYYKPTLDEPYQKIKTVTSDIDTTFLHVNEGSIAGCYYITAVDSFMNESTGRDSFCVDNCPLYTLPNVFTPDGDQVNDYYKPFPYKFVRSIDLQIFNRWGQVVFETTDPDILWNGVGKSGHPVTDGVYYYTCTVNEIRLAGIIPRELSGYIHVFRSSSTIPPKVN